MSRFHRAVEDDFLVLAKMRLELGRNFAGVFFLSPQVSVGYAVQELEIYGLFGEPEDFKNRVIFLE